MEPYHFIPITQNQSLDQYPNRGVTPHDPPFSKLSVNDSNDTQSYLLLQSNPTLINFKPVQIPNIPPIRMNNIRRQLTGVELYINFLDNKQKNESNKTFCQILQYNSLQLEADHGFIQWIFPLPQISNYTSNIPVIDIAELLIATKKYPKILLSIQLSYHLMIKHWGFDIEYSNMKNPNAIHNPFQYCHSNAINCQRRHHAQYLKLKTVNIDKLQLLNGHNGLRLSRVLQSLVYHGLQNLAIYTLRQTLFYTFGNQAILYPSYHDTSKTLWEVLLKTAILNVQSVHSIVNQNSCNYIECISVNNSQVKSI